MITPLSTISRYLKADTSRTDEEQQQQNDGCKIKTINTVLSIDTDQNGSAIPARTQDQPVSAWLSPADSLPAPGTDPQEALSVNISVTIEVDTRSLECGTVPEVNSELPPESVVVDGDTVNISSSTLIMTDSSATDIATVAQQTITVQSEDIESLYHSADYQTGFVGTEVVVNIVENVTLLLKNGWAYLGLRQSPLNLPLEPPAESSSNWVPWRHCETGGYELRMPATGDWKKLSGSPVDTAPACAAEIAGQYQTFSSETWGNTTFSNWGGMTLTCDGNFMISDSALATSQNGAGGTGSVSISAYSATDHQGSHSVFSALSQGNDSSTDSAVYQNQEVVQSLGHKFGRYEILDDGVTLEMQYANGSIHRQLFVRLGGRTLVNNKSYSYYQDDSLEFNMETLLEMTLWKSTAKSDSEWLERLSRAQKEASLERSRSAGRVSGDGA